MFENILTKESVTFKDLEEIVFKILNFIFKFQFCFETGI